MNLVTVHMFTILNSLSWVTNLALPNMTKKLSEHLIIQLPMISLSLSKLSHHNPKELYFAHFIIQCAAATLNETTFNKTFKTKANT